MRETEIEYEVHETEQERVYCDTCTADCTDDYEIIPQEVCPRCAKEHEPDEDNRFGTLGEYIEAYHEFEAETDDDPFLFDLALMTALWPVLVPCAILDGVVDGHDGGRYVATAALSTLLWASVSVWILFVL